MSQAAFRWALSQDVKPAGAKLLLASIGFRANRNDEAFPSKADLARDCGTSVSCVYKSLSKLVDLGLVTVTPRWDGERQISSRLKLNRGRRYAAVTPAVTAPLRGDAS